jgi:Flp pilus assembly protein TadG
MGTNMIIGRCLSFSRDCTGSIAIEFAMITPLLVIMLMAIIQFGLLFNNMSVLTNATASGALLFSQGRSFAAPYTSAVSAIQATAMTLNPANLTITVSVNGTVCASDAACQAAFGQGGIPATVTVAYPCPLVFSASTLQWLGINTGSFCPLSSSMMAVVQ